MVDYGTLVGGGSLGALLGAFFAVFLIIFLVFYVYMALVLMTIANKTDTPNAWLAWIPIANFYLMTQIAKVPWWTIFLMLLGVVPFVGIFVVLGVTIWWWWKISEARGKPGWYGILMLIPVVNFVMMGIIAWKD